MLFHAFYLGLQEEENWLTGEGLQLHRRLPFWARIHPHKPAMRYLRLLSLIAFEICCVGHALGQGTAVDKPSDSYSGPGAGMATWTGKIGKDETLTIQNGTPSTGVLSGAGLPGVPVRLVIDQSNLGIAEMPSGANGYRRLVLKSHGRHDKIVIHWTVIR